uniref:Nuclear receptor domain-containing protein n=1 Tax=Panagrolaimus sp. JU765 TaxID=591449 RepID=A0AC34QKB5_9BILA
MGEIRLNSSDCNICQVCGAPAKNKYQNIICCESCKAFYRRTSIKGETIRCPFIGKCDVEIGTRKLCRACRLQKCYKVGMGSNKNDPIKTPFVTENTDPLGQPLPIPLEIEPVKERPNILPSTSTQNPIPSPVTPPKMIENPKLEIPIPIPISLSNFQPLFVPTFQVIPANFSNPQLLQAFQPSFFYNFDLNKPHIDSGALIMLDEMIKAYNILYSTQNPCSF